MKKFLTFLIAIIVVFIALLITIKILLKPKEKYRQIYLVPANAAYIIETKNPFKSWEKIVYSDPWDLLSTNTFFAEVNKTVQHIDSTLGYKKWLFKLIGSPATTISCHKNKMGKYNFLYIIELGKFSEIHKLEHFFSSGLKNKMALTQRSYQNRTIYELFLKESGSYLFFFPFKNQLILSTDFYLIEASIKEMDQMTLGRDLSYMEIAQKIANRGIFRLYIQYSEFAKYIHSISGKTNTAMQSLFNTLIYSGFYFQMDDDGTLSLHGLSNTKDTVPHYLNALKHCGDGPFYNVGVIPETISAFVHMGFSDSDELYEQLQTNISTTQKAGYINRIEKIEKRLKINIKEHFFSWIDNEISIIQTPTSTSGSNDEFAVILKAKKSRLAQKNLNYITERIEQNMPVQFKSINYKDYTINYISIPGLFKLLFGNLLDKIEKPYYTIMDDFVIFSNHPQTLKKIIDCYLDRYTLSQSVNFYNFSKVFEKKAAVKLYVNLPEFYNNLSKHVSANLWQKIELNKDYLLSFPNLGIQVNEKDKLLLLDIYASFKEYVNPNSTLDFTISKPVNKDMDKEQPLIQIEENDTATIEETDVIVHDLDAKSQNAYYENGQLKVKMELKNGIKHGKYIEYYLDGTIKVQGKYRNGAQKGTWIYYTENGDIIRKASFD